MFNLTGKIAIVTGSARGIGQSIAVELARQGVNVVVTDIIPGNAELTDNYHRFPVKVSTMFITNNRFEKQIA